MVGVCQELPVSSQIMSPWCCKAKQISAGKNIGSSPRSNLPKPRDGTVPRHRHGENMTEESPPQERHRKGDHGDCRCQQRPRHIYKENGQRLGRRAWDQGENVRWDAVGPEVHSLAFLGTSIQGQRLHGLQCDWLSILGQQRQN